MRERAPIALATLCADTDSADDGCADGQTVSQRIHWSPNASLKPVPSFSRLEIGNLKCTSKF